MAVRPVVIIGDPVLHRPAHRVSTFDDQLAELVRDMQETMDAAHGVGLAAPQIGVALRVFVYHMVNEDGAPSRGVVVNPMLSASKVPTERPDPENEVEGCLSIPGESFPLKRADRARVTGYDSAGAALGIEATGWFARCLQHEFDHLNGKLYVDRLDERTGKKARRAIKARGWGSAGSSWMPGVDPDPFGHDEMPADGYDDTLV